MKYLVIEIQTFDNGNISTPTYAYDDRLAVEAKFHDIAASAARSALPIHAVAVMTSDGRAVDGLRACYRHVTEEPEPETDQTENETQEG